MISIDSQIYMWIMDIGYAWMWVWGLFLLINNKPWLNLDMYPLPTIHIQVAKNSKKLKSNFFLSNVVAIMGTRGLKDLKMDYYLT